MSKSKIPKLTEKNNPKFRGISAQIPELYHRKLRLIMLKNNIKSVGEWMCAKLKEEEWK